MRISKGRIHPIAGSALVHGRATITVNAPARQADRVVLDFDRYAEFMPEFSNSKILSHSHGGWQLFQEISALHGTIHMWARVQVPKPTTLNGAETIVATLVDGNVNAYEPKCSFAHWTTSIPS